jgi:FkbM family methyltransferase
MLSKVASLTKLLRRRRRARELGFTFTRARDLRVPASVRVGGCVVPIEAPDEPGIRVAVVDVLLDDCYGLRPLAASGVRSVLDVGANVGFFALAAREAFPQAAIHCYEPNPRLVPVLRRHVEAIGGVCHAEAVGLEEGRVELVDHADSVQVQTRSSDAGSVRQAPFREALARLGGSCDLVKLDCEGAEWGILRDAESWRRVRHLAMEYHLWAGDYRHEDAARAVRELGFKVVTHAPVHAEYGLLLARREGVA